MNTPYFRGSNEENAMATSPLAPPNTIHATPNRRVLGEMSTNPRIFSSPATGGMFSKRMMTGSPLKRSFTAAVEEGYGLKYLKKRRLSGDMGFGPVEQRAVPEPGRVEANGPLRAQSVPEPAVTHSEPTGGFPLSPTEPNTPSDSGGETQGSFSSLIDYDPTSRQGNASRSRRQREERREYEPRPELEPAFNSISRAETLRLRLRVAWYKVETNQVDVPFAELQAPKEEPMDQKRVTAAVEEAIATLRREAMERMPQPQGPAPKLIPGPPLQPTAHSSRMVHYPEEQATGPLPVETLFGAAQQMPANTRPGSVESASKGLLGLKHAF